MTSIAYDERRDRFLTAAAQVFSEKGYHSTTMRDLARATGMSLSGMYYYVEGKDELLFMIQERCFKRVLQGAKAAVDGAIDAEEKMRNFVKHHVGFFARHMDEMKVLSHDAESLSKQRIEGINELKRTYVDMLTELVGALRPKNGSPADSRVSAYALFGMMNWIYTWYDPAKELGPEALADQFAGIFLNGLTEAPTTSVAHGG